MRASLFVLSLVLAVAPTHAATKITKLKRLLVCAVDGEQTAEIGLSEKGGTKVNIADGLDAAASALAAELSAADIGFVPYAEAEGKAKALRATLEKSTEKALDGFAAATGAGAEMGANAGIAAAMAAAMNNPALPPEQREAMRKAYGGTAAQAGAGMQAKAKAGNADMMKGANAAIEAKLAASGSPSTRYARMYCPRPTDQIEPDQKGEGPGGGTHYFEFLDSVGADGWLFVSASFGGDSTSSAASGYGAVTTLSRYVPQWSLEARAYDKKGKPLWRSPVSPKTEELKLGKTVGSAQKAIAAGAADAVKALVEKLPK